MSLLYIHLIQLNSMPFSQIIEMPPVDNIIKREFPLKIHLDFSKIGFLNFWLKIEKRSFNDDDISLNRNLIL